MGSNLTSLPKGWSFVEDEPTLPEGWSFVDGDEFDFGEKIAPPKTGAKGLISSLTNLFLTEEEGKKEEEARLRSFELEEPERIAREARGTLKGSLSGLSFGLSEQIPGLKPDETDVGFSESRVVGEFAPITGLFKAFGFIPKIAQKSPYLAKALNSIARVAQSSAVGATEKGLKDVFQGKLPEGEELADHAIQWGLFDAALQSTGAVGKKLLDKIVNKSITADKPLWNVLNEYFTEAKKRGEDISTPERIYAFVQQQLEKEAPSATKAIEELRVKKTPESEKAAEIAETLKKTARPSTLDLTTKKIDETLSNRVSIEPPGKISKPISQSPEQIQKGIDEPLPDDYLESFEKAPETEQASNARIQQSVQDTFEAEKKEYSDLYKQAESDAPVSSEETADVKKAAEDILNKLDSLETKPPGYETTIRVAKSALKDAGYVVHENSSKLQNSLGLPKYTILPTSDIPITANRMQTLGRVLNEYVDFEAVEPSVKNNISKLAKAAKNANRKALAKTDPEKLSAFNAAELKYASTSKKFSPSDVQKIRFGHKTEELTKKIISPTTIDDLRNVLPDKQFRYVERRILDHLNSLSEDKARQYFNQVKNKLGPDAKRFANEILSSKAPKTLTTSQRTELWVAKQLQKETRPNELINHWKTSSGRKQITHSLRDNPNKENIIKYLQDQSFADFYSSIADASGKIDFKKLNSFLKDFNNLSFIRDTFGQDAVTFIRELKGYDNASKKAAERLDSIARRNQAKLDKNMKLNKARISKNKSLLTQKNITPKRKKTIQNLISLLESKNKNLEQAKKASGSQYGKYKLNQAVKREYPLLHKMDQILGSFGADVKKVLYLAMPFTFGVKKTIAAGIAYNLLRKLLQSRVARTSFRNLNKSFKQNNPAVIFQAAEKLQESLDSED